MGSISTTNIPQVLCAPGIKGKNIVPLPKDGLIDFMQSIIFNNQETKDPFYVLDLSVLTFLMDKWNKTLPMVQPFYAVKCNPNTYLLAALAALGSNFDCASRAEIEAVLSLGVSADRIVYANPCKAESHIKYAASVGVNLTTFDSKDELDKIQKYHPNCNLLLRVKPPDHGAARCPLGSKYGALPEEVVPLLEAAKEAQLNVIGVSFHIGSGATNAEAYIGAIAACKNVFETAARLGTTPMRMLNIGGGFTAGLQFDEAAKAIKEAMNTYFPNESGVQVISEPGRYFAELAMTLATNIIGKRVRGELREYWINDGVYGSMNCILYDHATITCNPLACHSNRDNLACNCTRKYVSTVFGPTCDALDTVLTGQMLPELQVNDWLVFPNMGAYTAAAGSNFNGFNTCDIVTYVVYSHSSCYN